MSGITDWGFVARHGLGFIINTGKKVKGYFRRKNVQGMDKAIKNHNSNAVSKKLNKLFKKAKNKRDSK